MSTSQAIIPGIPIVLAHGIKDGTNPIERVREDVNQGSPGLVILKEFDDFHGLHVIDSEEMLSNLVNEAIQLKNVKPNEEENKPYKPAPRVALFNELTKKNK